MRGMEKKLDITGEQVGTPRPRSSEDWRKKALYKISRTSEAAQERTSSSSDRDIESDAGMMLTNKRQGLRQQRWLENRRSGGVLSQSSDSTRYRLQNQGNDVQSRLNEKKSNTSMLGQRKGGGMIRLTDEDLRHAQARKEEHHRGLQAAAGLIFDLETGGTIPQYWREQLNYKYEETSNQQLKE